MCSFKETSRIFFSIFLLILACNAYAAEESITLTTYYPSPYGVYSEMRLYPKASATCKRDQEGLMYYDLNQHAFKVCVCKSPPTCSVDIDFDWVATTNYWTLTAPNLYPNNLAWNVGIGTADPGTKLEVMAAHANTELRLFSDQFGQGLGGANTANLNLWASEPGWTWTGGGIGNNAWILDSGGIGRVTTARGGSYIRLLDSGMQMNVINSTGTVFDGVFIDSAGNVGIGTAGPSARIHIAGPSAGAIKVVDGNQAAGRVLTSDANGVGTWQPPGGGGMSNIRVFTASGTFTVPAGITKLWVEVYGGGGAGGGSEGGVMTSPKQYMPGGGGGGGGGAAMGFVSVSPNQNIAVTAGAGGASGGCSSGGRGGTSSFSTLSATGGEGGNSGSGNWNRGGDGGVGSGGSINLRGSTGEKGLSMCYTNGADPTKCAGSTSIGGVGGSNSRGISGGGSQGEPGGVFGGGGTGNFYYCCMSCNYGGTGGSGGVIIWY